MEKIKVTSFTKLIVWQKAFKLVLLIYKTTKEFPKEKLYGIVSQIRRVAISISLNIAEGFSRIYKKEKIQFLYLSLGSLTELENLLLISKELNYFDNEKIIEIYNLCIEVGKLIQSSIKSLRVSF